MKKTKRVLMLVLALVMVFTVVAVPASATEAPTYTDTAIETIEPRRAPICGCGSVMARVDTHYGIWSVWDEVDCTHYPYGTDLEYRRTVTVTYRCGYCGATDEAVSHQYKTECHGYGV